MNGTVLHEGMNTHFERPREHFLHGLRPWLHTNPGREAIIARGRALKPGTGDLITDAYKNVFVVLGVVEDGLTVRLHDQPGAPEAVFPWYTLGADYALYSHRDRYGDVCENEPAYCPDCGWIFPDEGCDHAPEPSCPDHVSFVRLTHAHTRR